MKSRPEGHTNIVYKGSGARSSPERRKKRGGKECGEIRASYRVYRPEGGDLERRDRAHAEISRLSET